MTSVRRRDSRWTARTRAVRRYRWGDHAALATTCRGAPGVRRAWRAVFRFEVRTGAESFPNCARTLPDRRQRPPMPAVRNRVGPARPAGIRLSLWRSSMHSAQGNDWWREYLASRASPESSLVPTRSRNNGGRFDFDLGLRFHQRYDLHHRHRREMTTDDIAIRLPHLRQLGEILIAARDVPRESNDVLRMRARLVEHYDDVP